MSRIPVASLANGTLLASVPLVSSQNPSGAPMLTPAVGIEVNIFTHDTVTQVNIWSAETAGVVLTQPLASGSSGAVPGFIDTTDLPADLSVVNGLTYVLAGGSDGGGGGSGVVVSVAAEDATISVDGTVTNPILRVPALEGLLSAPADHSNQSSAVVYRGGQLKVVYEELNALDGFLTPNSVANQGAGWASFVNAVSSAVGGGGVGLLPSGIYDIGNTTVTPPVNTMCVIRGENGAAGYPSGAGTVLKSSVDTTNAPETTAVFTEAEGNKLQALMDMTLQGPARFATALGVRPAAVAAINIHGSMKSMRLNIQGFGAAILAGGATTSADHFDLEDIITSSCGWGIYQLPSRTYGDLHLDRCRLSANLASLACAASSNGFNGLWLHSSGLYAPYAFFRLDDGGPYGGVFVSGIEHFGANAEEPPHGFAYDELWNGGNGVAGVFQNSDLSAGSVQNPAGSGGWQRTFPITNISGSQITITTATGQADGFVMRKNMVASGSGWAGQTITAISAGQWPGPAYTFTMSGAPTGSPTQVTLSMPTRATIAVGAFTDVELGNAVGSETAVVAPFVVAPIACHDNRLSNGAIVGSYISAGQPFVDPLSSSVFSGTVGFGNQWGSVAPGSALYTSIEATGTISLNDLVETVVTSGNKRVQRAQGTGGRVVGTAQQAVSSGTPMIDIQCATSGSSGSATQVNNKTAGTISSGTRIKADALNPGGVTAVTSAADVSIGVTTAAILSGTSGPAVLDIGTIGVLSGPSGGGGGTYAGASLTPAFDQSGNVVVAIASDWGVDPATGFAYFNPSGATDGQEAILGLNSDGTLSLTQIQGQVP